MTSISCRSRLTSSRSPVKAAATAREPPRRAPEAHRSGRSSDRSRIVGNLLGVPLDTEDAIDVHRNFVAQEAWVRTRRSSFSSSVGLAQEMRSSGIHDDILTSPSMATATGRPELLKLALLVERASIAWMLVEAAVAFVLGVAAHSMSLIVFGLNSLFELVAGMVVYVQLGMESRGDTSLLAEERERKGLWAVGRYAASGAMRTTSLMPR